MKLLVRLYCASLILALAPPSAFANGQATSDEICLDQAHFALSFFLDFHGEAKVSKDQNKLKFVVFAGKGERKEVDLSRGEISIDEYPAIDASVPKVLHAGSANCPKPLFGADFESSPGDADAYRAARDRLYKVFATLKKSYDGDGEMKGNLQCTEKLLHDYLGQCRALEAPSPAIAAQGEGKQKSESGPLPPGVLPQTIKKSN